MEKFINNKADFRFQYLPDYAKFLLNNKLEEFVTVGIRFSRELNLPLLRHFSKMTEKELVKMGVESYREMLSALAENKIEKIIEKKISAYLNNRIKNAAGKIILDQTEIIAEDIILTFHIRRKLFSFFLYSYTQNTVVHILIANEVDQYTTQEHLLTTKAYVKTLQKKPSN